MKNSKTKPYKNEFEIKQVKSCRVKAWQLALIIEKYGSFQRWIDAIVNKEFKNQVKDFK